MSVNVDRKAPRPRMGRRELLGQLVALAASGWLPEALAQGAPSATLTPAQFSALCKRYTGYAFADPRVANAMLRALGASIGRANLSRLATVAAGTPPAQLGVALRAAGLERAAEIVVVALYTGVVDTPKGPIVVSYDQALIWQACGWTKPNAFCGGTTNYWATAPAGVGT
jgi:hypothetical protein